MQRTETERFAAQSYRTLNGSEVTLSGDGLSLCLPWSGSVRYLNRGVEFGFQSGPTGMADDALSDPHFSFSEFYEGYQGGRLRIGSVSVDDEYGLTLAGYSGADMQWLAAWEGESYSVLAVARVRREIEPDLITQFDNFTIHETQSGIVLEPAAGSRVEMFHAEARKEVPGLGLLSIIDAQESWMLIPSGSGTPVIGGELYLGSEEDHFLLVNATAVTIIQPLSDGYRIDDPSRLHLLESLKVEWKKS